MRIVHTQDLTFVPRHPLLRAKEGGSHSGNETNIQGSRCDAPCRKLSLRSRMIILGLNLS